MPTVSADLFTALCLRRDEERSRHLATGCPKALTRGYVFQVAVTAVWDMDPLEAIGNLRGNIALEPEAADVAINEVLEIVRRHERPREFAWPHDIGEAGA